MRTTVLSLGVMLMGASLASAQVVPGLGGINPGTPYRGYNTPVMGTPFGYGPGMGGLGGVANPYSAMPGYGGISGAFMPNIYNPATQPLSPYLNMLRGGNPAVNYYYGVRPGTGVGMQNMAQMGIPISANSQIRSGFLPAGANPTQEPIELPAGGAEISSLPPSGHPVSFSAGGRGMYGANRNGMLGNQAPPAMNRGVKK